MVQLTCLERGFAPNRPTDDGDVALDVRARPTILKDFTEALTSIGFEADGTSPEGHQHRWVRNEAAIDVLLPRGVGARAAARTGAGGRTTLESPGAQQALDRAEGVPVEIGSETGTIRRPNLLGALVSKAAAYGVPTDPDRERHLVDFAVLATMIERSDRIAEWLTTRDRGYIQPVLVTLADKRYIWATIQGAERGLELLETMVIRATTRPPTSHSTGR
jgi:hypothetical protein